MLTSRIPISDTNKHEGEKSTDNNSNYCLPLFVLSIFTSDTNQQEVKDK